MKYKNINIRQAVQDDAMQLLLWWNDPSVMTHAGFTKGLQTTLEKVAQEIASQSERFTLFIILINDVPVGEMNYRETEKDTCAIGIKICEDAYQNQGYGKIILSLFIEMLFDKAKYTTIILDTNLNNKRAQKLYEKLGFQQVKINESLWKNDIGVPQTSIDYSLKKKQFTKYHN